MKRKWEKEVDRLIEEIIQEARIEYYYSNRKEENKKDLLKMFEKLLKIND